MLRCKVFRSVAIFCLITVPTQGLAITIDQYDARVRAEVDFYAGKGELPSQDYRSNASFNVYIYQLKVDISSYCQLLVDVSPKSGKLRHLSSN